MLSRIPVLYLLRNTTLTLPGDMIMDPANLYYHIFSHCLPDTVAKKRILAYLSI